ncbi:MAG: hypothetical protein UX78_C0005G0025 [Candidatus Amesbacteria bacterium GW2011_GWA2_47_11]|uniref:Uncharacterized protein n=2 Tax=Candidatus Amesiibacteriota TaxID=1752730 RepID=A0A0G1WX48_9BACT|nr:MAG: hypothetical protein UX78_C0005G0025 [Candidatus Amesbacteria bacterium GW2011_GWA2_47_11]KKU94933.1 MAG: hypothetical protein UY22_C0004G0028 [Candidatus Amesbacteria bacterium GW2011_GWC1_48_10]
MGNCDSVDVRGQSLGDNSEIICFKKRNLRCGGWIIFIFRTEVPTLPWWVKPAFFQEGEFGFTAADEWIRKESLISAADNHGGVRQRENVTGFEADNLVYRLSQIQTVRGDENRGFGIYN